MNSAVARIEALEPRMLMSAVNLADYYPLVVDSVYEYAADDDGVESTVRQVVTAGPSQGQFYVSSYIDDLFSSARLIDVSSGDQLLLAQSWVTEEGTHFQVFQTPITLLPEEAQTDQAFSDSSDYDLYLSEDYYEATMPDLADIASVASLYDSGQFDIELAFDGYQEVVKPNGTFTCLTLAYENSWEDDESGYSGTDSYRLYLARSVGQIAKDMDWTSTADGETNTGTQSYRLSDFSVADVVEKHLHFSSKRSVQYTASNGVKVTVSISGSGSGDIYFAQDLDTDADLITVYNTSSRSSLSIKTKGNAATEVGQIEVAQNIDDISASRVTLIDGLFAKGLVGSVKLADLADTQILLNTDATAVGSASVSLEFDNVADLSLDTGGMPIKKLKVIEWLDSGDAETIIAPWIKTLSVTGLQTRWAVSSGDWQPNLQLSGAAEGNTLGTVSIAGEVGSATWDITGDVGSCTFGSTSYTWELSADEIAAITTRTVFGAQVTAQSIGKMKLGSMVGATLDLQAEATESRKVFNLKSLTVSGPIDTSGIYSAGNIGTIKCNQILDSTVYAGVISDGRPADREDFLDIDDALLPLIGSFEIARNDEQGFSNTNIAAWTINKITLRDVNGQADDEFGVIANTLKNYTRYEASTKAKTARAAAGVNFDVVGDYYVDLLLA